MRQAPDNIQIDIGQRIRQLRESKGYTLQDIADVSGYGTRAGVSNLETRTPRALPARLLWALRMELDADLNWIVTGEEPRPPGAPPPDRRPLMVQVTEAWAAMAPQERRQLAAVVAALAASEAQPAPQGTPHDEVDPTPRPASSPPERRPSGTVVQRRPPRSEAAAGGK